MRVKEMHPLCCIQLESPGLGNQSPEALTLARTQSLPTVGSDRSNATCQRSTSTTTTAVAGVIYKWTNYSKGWRSRWFLFTNGVLSYAKIRSPENLNLLTPSNDVILIGDISTNRLARMDRSGSSTRRKNHTSSSGGVVHLKVLIYL